MDDYSTRQMDRHHPQKAPRFERNDTDEWMGIKLKSLDRVPTDDALHADCVPPNEHVVRSFLRLFVVRPSPEPTSRARVSRRVQPSDDVDETPTVGIVFGGRPNAQACVSRVYSLRVRDE